jgi:hypothetical protein
LKIEDLWMSLRSVRFLFLLNFSIRVGQGKQQAYRAELPYAVWKLI